MAKSKKKSKSSKKQKKAQVEDINHEEVSIAEDKIKNDVQERKENTEIKSENKIIEESNKNIAEGIDVAKEINKNENIKQEEVHNKNEEKKELSEPQLKEIAKAEEKPTYVQEMIKKRKRIATLLLTIIVTSLFLIIFSTIFAILNTNNSKIINGVSVKNIDISNLTKEDAIKRLTQALNKELNSEINLSYGKDYNVTLKPEQIEFIYDIRDSVENAYKVGRKGNVLIDNYTIVYTALFGKNLKISYSYNGELLNQFVEDIRAKLPGIVIEPTYYIENDNLFVNKGIDGIELKKEDLRKQIIISILERDVSKITEGFKQKIEIPIEMAIASSIDIKRIQSEIYREPQNAYFQTEPYKIYPDIDGIDLVMSINEAQALVDKENKDEYKFALKITKAEISVDDLGKEAFPYLISRYSTKYDASNRNRSTNLKIAAEKINGKVLMPGEEFSFNKIVGKRTVEAGYKEAAIYADGGVVDGLAGGICQISSTLYNSVLMANLQIAERRNHTFTTSYVPAGRDATVVWGTTDFRFINSRTYPIKIEATVNNGIVEFKIYGMQEEVEYEVKILPVRTKSIPYITSYEEDATIFPGQQIVKQAGHAGCKVTTYKELRINGEIVFKEPISNDTYKPMRAIIKVAPGNVPQ